MQQAQDSHDNADFSIPAQGMSPSCPQPPQKGYALAKKTHDLQVLVQVLWTLKFNFLFI